MGRGAVFLLLLAFSSQALAKKNNKEIAGIEDLLDYDKAVKYFRKDLLKDFTEEFQPQRKMCLPDCKDKEDEFAEVKQKASIVLSQMDNEINELDLSFELLDYYLNRNIETILSGLDDQAQKQQLKTLIKELPPKIKFRNLDVFTWVISLISDSEDIAKKSNGDDTKVTKWITVISFYSNAMSESTSLKARDQEIDVDFIEALLINVGIPTEQMLRDQNNMLIEVLEGFDCPLTDEAAATLDAELKLVLDGVNAPDPRQLRLIWALLQMTLKMFIDDDVECKTADDMLGSLLGEGNTQPSSAQNALTMWGTDSSARQATNYEGIWG